MSEAAGLSYNFSPFSLVGRHDEAKIIARQATIFIMYFVENDKKKSAPSRGYITLLFFLLVAKNFSSAAQSIVFPFIRQRLTASLKRGQIFFT